MDKWTREELIEGRKLDAYAAGLEPFEKEGGSDPDIKGDYGRTSEPTPAGAGQGDVMNITVSSHEFADAILQELDPDGKIQIQMLEKELDTLRAENAKLQTQINSVVTLWNNRQETIEAIDAENVKLRAALFTSYVSFNHIADTLNSISVVGWPDHKARALGYAAGFFQRLHDFVVTNDIKE